VQVLLRVKALNPVPIISAPLYIGASIVMVPTLPVEYKIPLKPGRAVTFAVIVLFVIKVGTYRVSQLFASKLMLIGFVT